MPKPDSYLVNFTKEGRAYKVWVLAKDETHARHQIDELNEPDRINFVHKDDGMW